MKVLREGVLYELESFHQPDHHYEKVYLRFVHREPVTEGKILVTKMNGTTLTEVLEACNSCLNYMNNQLPCEENSEAMLAIKVAIQALSRRKKDREKRGALGKHIL